MGQDLKMVHFFTIPMKLAVKDVIHHLSCPAFGRAFLDFGFSNVVAADDADYARMMEQIQHSLFKTSAAQKRRLLCRRSRISSVRCRTLNKMLAIRLYISALTLLFLSLVLANRGLGILEAAVITCALIYLILDIRMDLQSLKSELRLLKELEKRISCSTSS
jgi:hypothetical protein